MPGKSFHTFAHDHDDPHGDPNPGSYSGFRHQHAYPYSACRADIYFYPNISVDQYPNPNQYDCARIAAHPNQHANPDLNAWRVTG